ncbi:hypothetical protein DITRI_Ditri06bG0010200 [Diplodiscus trichospermus]
MAGLQYNFFPTDFYYPRPQTIPVDADRVAAVSIQRQKKEVGGGELEWPRSLGFRVRQEKNVHGSKGGVPMHQNQGIARIEDQGKLVKYSPSPNPLCWFTLIPEAADELSDSS